MRWHCIINTKFKTVCNRPVYFGGRFIPKMFSESSLPVNVRHFYICEKYLAQNDKPFGLNSNNQMI